MTDSDDSNDQAPASRAGSRAADAELGSIARFDALTSGGGPTEQTHFLPDRLSRAVVEILGVQGAAISVYLGADIAVPVGASDLTATMGEALQFTVREGPCFAAYSRRRPVLAADIDHRDAPAWSTWPTYAEQLTRHTPYRGVFAYPLLAAGLVLGSLSLYRSSSGEPAGLEDVPVIAARIADRLLEAEVRTGSSGEPEHQWMKGPTALRRRRVWLAQGLTLQANRITPGEALDLLRAMAFTSDRLLDDLAEDIVAGRLPVPVLESQQ
jgi:hypothetical protein